MNKVAEQDSLEALIAKLRGATLGLCSEDASGYIPRGVSAADCAEAADTLSQMRDALVAVRRQASLNGKGSNLCRLIIETVDAALTTTKIEKSA